MEALYIILGATLALGGGVLTHHVQLYYAQQKEENNLLFEIERSLLEIGGLDSELNHFKTEPDTLDTKAKVARYREQKSSQLENLHLLAIRIISDKNRSIAVKVAKYSIDKHHRTDENRYVLLKLVQQSMNSKLLKQYQKETDTNPTVF
ncbi:hypothetical protein H5125_06700 [Shewanella sp. SR44-4]|jgi:hypothetical protein|uniref:hypothetical protein n=1 Tax=Shewanella sp. SR44-4 TaxID=2760935 RepID=UPI0016042692|nr:hypothetical protein [Shewanella sp. SR44-4]MBB1361837.1 hypothetical protein [Shewanella sp. SR44-4]